MSDPIEITGKFLRDRYRFAGDNGDTVIAEVHCGDDGRATVKGIAGIDDLIAGVTYRFFGKWTNYKNKRTGMSERQFSFTSFVGLAPIDRDAIIGYLASHGAGHGLGKVRAARLWELLGEDAVRIARTDPTRVVAELKSVGLRFSELNATNLAASLQADEAVEAIKLDLTSLITGRGFPRNLVNVLIQTWGNRAATILRRNPYRLLKFGGCGFKRCDSMYLDLGLNPARLKRQAVCAWHSIDRDNDGHTWHSRNVPDAFLRTHIGGAGPNVERALELATRAKLIAEVRTVGPDGPISENGDYRWFADYKQAAYERQLSERILNG